MWEGIQKEHKHICRILYILDKNIQNKMHWSFLVCLMYLWKTRGTTTVAGVKSCSNCKFFLPPTLDIHNKQNAVLGKCLLYPYSDKTVSTLVVGMADLDVGGNFHYAVTARASETMCGHSAQQFSPRFRTPHPPKN